VTPSLFGFRDRREFPENLLEAFGKASYKLLKDALVAFAQGRTEFIREVGDRSPHGEERHLLLHAKIDSSRAHDLSRVCVAITDITPIKGAEKDLKRSETTYRQAFERAVVPMILVDVGTEIILDASSAFQQILGVSVEALQGAHVGQCFPTNRRERCVEDLGNMLRGKRPIVDTLFLSRRDGTEVSVSAKSHALSAGDHPCAVVSFSPAAAAVSPWERRTKVDRRASSTLRRKLTDRERLILSLITTGLTNKAIAERLSISRKTVETHRLRIMQKLDIHKATDLVRLALTSGLLAED
jgi:PAS domain S-box-containing protein